MKRTITKVLSILCLLAMLGSVTMPAFKLTGDYMGLLNGVTSVTAQFNDETIAAMEQMIAAQNLTVDLRGAVNGVNALTEPLAKGEISLKTFWELSEKLKALGASLSTFPADGLGIPQDTTDPVQQAMLGISNLIAQFGSLAPLVTYASYICLAPIALFALFALSVVLRIILRLFNRRGLGVMITLNAWLNAAIILAVPVALEIFLAGSTNIGAEVTAVPYIIAIAPLASCILWAIGRGPKVKKVKEEVVVETPVETPVEEAVVEEAPVEETVVEEVVEVEETVEETVEE